jgi:hypothetical protein
MSRAHAPGRQVTLQEFHSHSQSDGPLRQGAGMTAVLSRPTHPAWHTVIWLSLVLASSSAELLVLQNPGQCRVGLWESRLRTRCGWLHMACPVSAELRDWSWALPHSWGT